MFLQKILQFQKRMKIETITKDDITKLAEMTQKYDTKQVEPLLAFKNQTKLEIDLGLCKICSNDSISVTLSYKHNKCHQVSSLDVCPCTICDEWFPSVQDLEKHVSFHDKSKDPAYLYCNVCKFSSKAKILNKGQTGPYNSRVFGNRLIKEHIRSHEKIYRCEVCEKIYNSQRALQGHAQSVHSAHTYKCDQCEYRSNSKYIVDKHAKRRHTEDKDKVYKFMCSKCDKKFFLKDALPKHMKSMHPETGPVSCLECSRSFRTEERLSFHFRNIHSDIQKNICSECGNKFLREYELLVHKRLHTGERPYKCDICQATFYKAGHKGRHMKIHTGVRPHICSICGKGFIQKNNMVLHQLKCE